MAEMPTAGITIFLGPEEPGDPAWTAAREKFGKLAYLLRIVDLNGGTDEIVPLNARIDFADCLLDGCCLIKPKPDKPA